MNKPGFTAVNSLASAGAQYYGGGNSARASAIAQPAQIIFDPCLLSIPNINVGWQSFGDGSRGAVIVSGNSFAGRSNVRVRFDNCTSAFPELGFTTANACGQFTMWHTCTCAGPPITVEASDGSGNSATGTVRQIC
jgi:hypothetical protein